MLNLHKKIKQLTSLLIVILLFSLAGCGESSSSSGGITDLTGEWRGTARINSEPTTFDLRMSITQGVLTNGAVSSADGNILIEGLCVFVFTGGSVSQNQNTFFLNQGDISLSTRFTSDTITGSLTSTNSPEDDGDGCGIFRADISFERV